VSARLSRHKSSTLCCVVCWTGEGQWLAQHTCCCDINK
jgi:hypothetical protein